MAVRAALLTSRNINLDSDFSKYIETVSDPGVITGFEVTASAVGIGKAWVLCERTNGETIYTFVQNFNPIAISGNGYVIVSIPQEIVDNGGGNEDGTGIASIDVVNTLPTKNYLLLATITGGTVTDNRYIIPKVSELDTINGQITDLDERVDALEAAGAIDHLEELLYVGEKYALTDILYKQVTPSLSNCTVEAKVGNVAANTEIHIQRQGSGTASNKLKIKVKKTGAPVDLVVEVRKGIEVDVSNKEAYWYGDSENIITTATIAHNTITTSWQELEITLDAEFGGNEGELLDIVLKQNNGAVDASNYYTIACDSTQRSECFSYVSVNGSTRARSKLMPYAISDGFKRFLLAKSKLFEKKLNGTIIVYNNSETVTAISNETVGRYYEGYMSFGRNYRPSSISGFRTSTGLFHIFNTDTDSYTLDTNGNNMASDFGTQNFSGIIESGKNSVSYEATTVGTHDSVYNSLYYNFDIYYNNTITKNIKIFDLKGIGTKISAYLFGMMPNNTRWDGN